MFIKISNRYINIDKLSYFEEINEKPNKGKVQLFFNDAMTSSVMLDTQDTKQFLEYMNELGEIYPKDDSNEDEVANVMNLRTQDTEKPSVIEELEEAINTIRTSMERKWEVRSWAAQDLRRKVQELKSLIYDKAAKKRYADTIDRLQSEAVTVAEKAEVYAHCFVIDNLLSEPIINIQHIDRRQRELASAQRELEKLNQLTDEYKYKIRSIKEQAAWFRAKRKIAEAEVIVSTGNTNKADKLYREASVTLNQDWVKYFPDEEPPVINQNSSNNTNLF